MRGSPLQLSYDAKVLEPVAVRAGEFFAEGSFTYRVNPSGSITVGAFGKGDVPDDAEFVVVTFKPIRAGATTELKLFIPGAAGRRAAPSCTSRSRRSVPPSPSSSACSAMRPR